MLRRFRTWFAPAEPHAHHVHYHFDDHGRRRFCDESRCRPANDPLTALPLLPPYR